MEGLAYNTAADDMVIPAYGRYVQAMLERAVELEPERQQGLVERVVQMMAQLSSDSESMTKEDQERRLWKHAYRLSGYRLTAVPPDGSIPQPAEDYERPAEVPYPKSVSTHRNYGEYVGKMIERARAVEDPQRKAAITKTIASYMKLAYSTYNDAQNISDKTILGDLRKMSDGELELDDKESIDAYMGRGSQSHIKQEVSMFKSRKRNKNKGGGSNNRRRFRKR